VATATSSPVKSLRLQPHLDSDIEKLVGMVWFLRTSSGWEDLRIVMEIHHQLFFLLRLWDGCGLLDPFGNFSSATNNVRLTQGGAAAAAHRRHGLEVEDEGHLKNFIVIFIFVQVPYIVRCFF
jgi:hypothetical protein